jgi:hypothetical protein
MNCPKVLKILFSSFGFDKGKIMAESPLEDYIIERKLESDLKNFLKLYSPSQIMYNPAI